MNNNTPYIATVVDVGENDDDKNVPIAPVVVNNGTIPIHVTAQVAAPPKNYLPAKAFEGCCTSCNAICALFSFLFLHFLLFVMCVSLSLSLSSYRLQVWMMKEIKSILFFKQFLLNATMTHTHTHTHNDNRVYATDDGTSLLGIGSDR